MNMEGTIVAGHAAGATLQARQASLELLRELTSGQLASSWSAAWGLLGSAHLEVQQFALTVLQHLVQSRWGELSQEEASQAAQQLTGLLDSCSAPTTPFPVRSKVAVLLAEAIKHGDSALWRTVLQKVATMVQAGPCSASMALLILKYAQEEITQPSSFVQQDAKRLLLAELISSLDTALPIMHQVVGSYSTEWQRATSSGDAALLRSSIMVLTDALSAAAAFAEWAPVGLIMDCGLIDDAANVATVEDLRLDGVEVLRSLAERKAKDEDVTKFRAVMARCAEALQYHVQVLTRRPDLHKRVESGGVDEDYAKRLCDTMSVLGCNHWGAIGESTKVAYLQAMLGFLQQEMTLSSWAMPFWAELLRQESARRSNRDRAAAAPSSFNVPDEAVLSVLDLVSSRLLQVITLHETDPDATTDPLAAFDSPEEWHSFYAHYKNSLQQVSRLGTAICGSQVMVVARSKLEDSLRLLATNIRTPELATAAQLEASVSFLEAIMQALPQSDFAVGSAASEHCGALLEQILQLTGCPHPQSATSLVHAIVSLGKYLATHAESMARVLEYVFGLLGAIELESAGAPPATPPPGWREAYIGRTKVVGGILGLAQQCPQALGLHLDAIANLADQLMASQRLRYGERNVVVEGLLTACASLSAGPERTHQIRTVLNWALGPLKAEWSSQAVQEALQSPQKFVAYYCPIQAPDEHVANLDTPPDSLPDHPVQDHLQWAFPTMLAALGNIHALSGPSGRRLLGPFDAALDPSPYEKLVLLGQNAIPGGAFAGRGLGYAESGGSVAGPAVPSLRSWLRGLRETSYQIINLAFSRVPKIYLEPELAAAANDEVMRERILRDISKEHCTLLSTIAVPSPVPGDPTSQQTPLQFLLHTDFSAGEAAVMTAVDALVWQDTDSTHKAVIVCRTVIDIARETKLQGLCDLVGGRMMRNLVIALTHASNQVTHGEMVGLIRDVIQLSHLTSEVRATLAMLIGETEAASFLSEFASKPKEAEQRALIKKLLLRAAGSALKAMAQPRVQAESVGAISAQKARAKPKYHQPAAEEEPGHLDWLDL
ncbi:unnamed protein product [Pedinophyceae sp. YPF-701]|nr:unnamed protein product [Pedinophyceae sp. YPF-701]